MSANDSVSSAKVAIPVNAVLTHGHVHLDEVCAIWLIQGPGKNFFPGVDKGDIRFVSQNPKGNDASYDADRILPVGCGGGRFDEHTQSGRKPGQCATTLVADYIGVRERADLKPLIDEILECDSRGGVHSLQMAEIMKAAHRCMPGGDKSTIKWAMTGLGWVYHQLKYSYAKENGVEPTAMTMLNQFLDRHTVADKIANRLRVLCQESDTQVDRVTGLGFVVMAMYRSKRKVGEIYEWVESAFQWFTHDQEQLWEVIEATSPGKPDESGVARSKDGKSVQYCVPATMPDHTTRKIKLLVVQSDNHRAHRAAMYLKPAILVLRHSDGHTQIFCHRQSGLDADVVADIVAHLRYWEGGKDARLTWEELRSSGDVECSPYWHFKADALWILNGSETHSGVPATTLPLSSIVQAVRRALFLPDLRRWQKEMGIEIPEKKPKARPLASVGEIAEANHHVNGGDKKD